MQQDGALYAWTWDANNVRWMFTPGTVPMPGSMPSNHSGLPPKVPLLLQPCKRAQTPAISSCMCYVERNHSTLVWLEGESDSASVAVMQRHICIFSDSAQSHTDDYWEASVLAKYDKAEKLFSGGGEEFWVCTGKGVAYRWNLRHRQAITRVNLLSFDSNPLLALGLHFPSLELLGLTTRGRLITIGPPLADGPSPSQASVPSSDVETLSAPDIRCVGTITVGKSEMRYSSSSTLSDMEDRAAKPSQCNLVAMSVQATLALLLYGPSEASPHGRLTLQHVPTGSLLADLALPMATPLVGLHHLPAAPGPGDALATCALCDAGAAGLFIWRTGSGHATAVWQPAVHVPTAVATAGGALLDQDPRRVAHRNLEEVQRDAKLLREMHAECGLWGGALERAQGALLLADAELEFQGLAPGDGGLSALCHPLLRTQSMLPGMVLSKPSAEASELLRLQRLYQELYPEEEPGPAALAALARSGKDEQERQDAAAASFDTCSLLGRSLAPLLRDALVQVRGDEMMELEQMGAEISELEDTSLVERPWFAASVNVLKCAAKSVASKGESSAVSAMMRIVSSRSTTTTQTSTTGAALEAAEIVEDIMSSAPDDFYLQPSARRGLHPPPSSDGRALAHLLAHMLCRHPPKWPLSSAESAKPCTQRHLSWQVLAAAAMNGDWFQEHGTAADGAGASGSASSPQGPLGSAASWAALPAFDGLCVCLHMLRPEALLPFVRQMAAHIMRVVGELAKSQESAQVELGSTGAVLAMVAERALNLLPPANAHPTAQEEPSLQTVAQAELLCMIGTVLIAVASHWEEPGPSIDRFSPGHSYPEVDPGCEDVATIRM
ncbi:hypothetical protein CYMTET_32154 [Cymbomonas tetramitiformis]|uniref:Uncharacterized protein n=1 Tax=Cymbomonas tetramitiformis TaxID=36881 RepID=A0AAE0FFD3_9CHLO|nr:hypothetical protein CYMTET_32154 [Cymbomonas tetramitiformis]